VVLEVLRKSAEEERIRGETRKGRMEKREIKRQEEGRVQPSEEEKRRLEDTKEKQIHELKELLEQERKRGLTTANTDRK